MRLLLILVSLFTPTFALAHGFGERIDLPLPLDFYLTGGGIAVLASFVALGFVSEKWLKRTEHYKTLSLSRLPVSRILLHRWVGHVVRFFALLFFFVVVYAGLFGSDDPLTNIAPTALWVLFGVGLTYFTIIFGNIWSLINPIKTVYHYACRLLRDELSLERPLPTWVGVWPALVLFVAYRWIENIYPNSFDPQFIGYALLSYSILTLVGIFIFGRKWFSHGEAFTVFFNFLSRFSLTEVRGGNIHLRPPAVGLLYTKASFSELVFVLFMLASVAFDGFLATSFWVNKVLTPYAEIGVSPLVVGTIGLILLLMVFVVGFLIFMYFSKFITRTKSDTLTLGKQFVYSLLPIAVGYELAHFASLLLTEGQRLITFVSDPFGFGWDLLGTAHYTIAYEVVNLKVLWNFQVAVIVIGHIIAVYIAHVLALKVFSNNREALLSQFPILVLMVLYTTFSLWLLAQPIIIGGL